VSRHEFTNAAHHNKQQGRENAGTEREAERQTGKRLAQLAGFQL